MDGSKEITTQAKPTAQTKPETSSSEVVSGQRKEQTGSSTASSAAAEEVDKRLFEIRLSIRYHSKRQKHFEVLEAGSNFLLLLLGSGAVATAATSAPLRSIGMMIAAITAMKIAFKPAYRAMRHERFVDSFTELETKLLSSKDDEEVDQVVVEILKLEAKEPPVLINLSVICYNEVAISEGQEDYVRYLGRWQEFMARWMDWRPYHAIKS